jgi:hypothetical protein
MTSVKPANILSWRMFLFAVFIEGEVWKAGNANGDQLTRKLARPSQVSLNAGTQGAATPQCDGGTYSEGSADPVPKKNSSICSTKNC